MTTSPTSASPSKQPSTFTELLAPAGDWDCAKAAIQNGADAIYFGLDCGFNARHRAKNFHIDELPELLGELHVHGVRGYVTMNTLAFASELRELCKVIEAVADRGVDAILVQDFGIAQMARTICPELEVHASTQMSLTSAETVEVARDLGIKRVVLARELSVQEIEKITSQTDLPVEVFVHGALCVAYSGQCLTSESLGGRSANRGQCAQACRLPYEAVRDGETVDLGDQQFLMSPQDLAGYESIPRLMKAGVASLKIEGRLKTPEYVANVCSKYRTLIDAVQIDNEAKTLNANQHYELEMSFSRGLSPGWLEGNDHKRLVPAITSAKQGVYLGTLLEWEGPRIRIRPHENESGVDADARVSIGDGIAIGSGEETVGGRIHELFSNGVAVDSDRVDEEIVMDLGRNFEGGDLKVGDRVYKNDDPELNRRLRTSFQSADSNRRLPLGLTVHAKLGEPLRMVASAYSAAAGSTIEVSRSSEAPLELARKRPADEETIREKATRMGGTPFVVQEFSCHIEGGPMVPLSSINQLRRELTDQLERDLRRIPTRQIHAIELNETAVTTDGVSGEEKSSNDQTQINVLCRTIEQVRSIASSDHAKEIYVDFHDVRQYAEAIEIASHHQCPISIASVRIQKPSEMGLLKKLLRDGATSILARNLAAIRFGIENQLRVVADFSLNLTNYLSVDWILSLGVDRWTVSYDLDREQVNDLIQTVDAQKMEIVLHQHMPMFHMEHCVFCGVLSPGTDKTNCGRPCDRHQVNLKDRAGALHVLQADVACRNTLYNERAQSGAEMAVHWNQSGVQQFRVELLEEDAQQSLTTISLYHDLLAGRIDSDEVWQKLKARNRIGVTRGTLEVI